MKNVLLMCCLLAGVLCLLYYVGIVCYAGITADFAWIWLVGGISLLALRFLWGYALEQKNSFLLFCVRGCWILIGICVCVFLYIGAHILGGMFARPEPGLDYVIVLGAQVRGSTPSRALRKRLDRAEEYAKENPDTLFFLSGGQGSGEDITEAEAMRRYLVDAGVSEEKLLLEKRSTNTKENLQFCAEIVEIREKRVGILSNDFHVYRAVQLASQLGYKKVFCIPADSDWAMQPHYLLREACAIFAAVVKGNMRLSFY